MELPVKPVQMTLYLGPTAQQVSLIFVKSSAFGKVESLSVASYTAADPRKTAPWRGSTDQLCTTKSAQAEPRVADTRYSSVSEGRGRVSCGPQHLQLLTSDASQQTWARTDLSLGSGVQHPQFFACPASP